MHASPPFITAPDARRFREMRWGRGSQRAVLAVERDDETEVNRRIWRWLGSRAVRQDFRWADQIGLTVLEYARRIRVRRELDNL